MYKRFKHIFNRWHVKDRNFKREREIQEEMLCKLTLKAAKRK
jgi:hypothetical protein